MARPTKKGLDYFPLDTALNDKIKLIEAEFGCKGFAVVVKLFQKIYGELGYYCEWTNEVALMFTREKCPDVGLNAVSEIVTTAIRRKIFDKEMFDKYGILTSRGIQERYLEATQRRASQKIDNRFRIACDEKKQNPATKTSVFVNRNTVNECKNATKEIKENKRKVNKKMMMMSSTSGIHSEALKFYRENINHRPSPYEVVEISYWIDQIGCEDEMLIEAMKMALGKGSPNWSYIKGILENKTKAGIKTVEAFRNSEAIWRERKKASASKKTAFSGYENQREFDPNDISERQQQLLEEILEERGER